MFLSEIANILRCKNDSLFKMGNGRIGEGALIDHRAQGQNIYPRLTIHD